jgi:hypothetical protein
LSKIIFLVTEKHIPRAFRIVAKVESENFPFGPRFQNLNKTLVIILNNYDFHLILNFKPINNTINKPRGVWVGCSPCYDSLRNFRDNLKEGTKGYFDLSREKP